MKRKIDYGTLAISKALCHCAHSQVLLQGGGGGAAGCWEQTLLGLLHCWCALGKPMPMVKHKTPLVFLVTCLSGSRCSETFKVTWEGPSMHRSPGGANPTIYGAWLIFLLNSFGSQKNFQLGLYFPRFREFLFTDSWWSLVCERIGILAYPKRCRNNELSLAEAIISGCFTSPQKPVSSHQVKVCLTLAIGWSTWKDCWIFEGKARTIQDCKPDFLGTLYSWTQVLNCGTLAQSRRFFFGFKNDMIILERLTAWGAVSYTHLTLPTKRIV